MTTFVNIAFVSVMILLILFICSNVIDLLFGFSDYQISKSRLKQFQKGTKEAQASTKEQLLEMTGGIKDKLFPMLQSILPSLKVESIEQRDKDLKFIGWDDTFTAESFLATSITLSPFSAKIFANSRPIPEEAPVIRTVLFKIKPSLLRNKFR